MACEYFIGDKKFSEQEFKDFLAKEGLDMFIEEKAIDLSKVPPKPPIEELEAENESFKQRMRSFYRNVINRSKGLTQEQKDLLKENPNALYDVLPHEQSRKIARELIDEIGV